MTTFNPRRLVTTAALGAALIGYTAHTADAGFFAKLKAKLSCHTKPACCQPAPACDPCGAPAVSDCGCGGETVVISESVVIEASPSEQPTPVDAAPQPPMMKKEGSGSKEAMMKKEGSGSKEKMMKKEGSGAKEAMMKKDK